MVRIDVAFLWMTFCTVCLTKSLYYDDYDADYDPHLGRQLENILRELHHKSDRVERQKKFSMCPLSGCGSKQSEARRDWRHHREVSPLIPGESEQPMEYMLL